MIQQDWSVVGIDDYTMRPLAESDLRMVLNWRNSPRVSSMMLTDHIISWKEHKNWYQCVKSYIPPHNFVFCYKNEPIGYIGYTEYDRAGKHCSPGVYLGKEDAPMLAGLCIAYYAVEYAFQVLGMNYLETSVLKKNKHVYSLNKRLGYKDLEDEIGEHSDDEKTVHRIRLDAADWLQNKPKIYNKIRELNHILCSI